MTARASAGRRALPRVVAVIASRSDLDLAIRMHRPPDLFELRLDHLVRATNEVEKNIPRLRSPVIITARHPQEGGANSLPLRERRTLLTRFLPYADYVDIELRSVFALKPLITLANQKKVRLIISFHDFKLTPAPRILLTKARAAEADGARIFKIATRTDTPLELGRLLDLMTNRDVQLPVSAMGVGKLGAISRVLLARSGSVLVYASLTTRTNVEGQLSLDELRALGIW
jgi:3-dehydroquinate dehydratase-1